MKDGRPEIEFCGFTPKEGNRFKWISWPDRWRGRNFSTDCAIVRYGGWGLFSSTEPEIRPGVVAAWGPGNNRSRDAYMIYWPPGARLDTLLGLVKFAGDRWDIEQKERAERIAATPMPEMEHIYPFSPNPCKPKQIKVTQRALDALDESRDHWWENVRRAERGAWIRYDGEDCALCQEFNRKSYNACSGCPIRSDSGRPGCAGTPYDFDNTNAQAMLDYLNDLRSRCVVEESK